MKKYIFLILLCNVIFALPIQNHRVDPTALSELASSLGIPDGADLILETQKRWLRKSQERWEVAELSPSQKDLVLDWARTQGLFTSWMPLDKVYDKALILGATTSHMQMRLEYLNELWNEGLRFKELIWLTGDRPLDKRVDALTDRCKNESEAARILWNETNLQIEMRNLPVTFITVPMKAEEGTLKRPNTEDTIIAWLKTAPPSCKALFVSDQPFCGYQFAILKNCLPESIQFDLVGQGIEPENHPTATITLDSVARWIYEESLHSPFFIK